MAMFDGNLLKLNESHWNFTIFNETLQIIKKLNETLENCEKFNKTKYSKKIQAQY